MSLRRIDERALRRRVLPILGTRGSLALIVGALTFPERRIGPKKIVALVAALAGEPEVVWLTGPSAVLAGQAYSATVTVSQAPPSVTFTSTPPGLVNFTTTVTSATQAVSVPTSSSAAPGSYTIKAAPTAGGTSKTKGIAVATP